MIIYIYLYNLFRNHRVQCSLESRKTQPKECRSRVKFIGGGGEHRERRGCKVSREVRGHAPP